MKLKFMSSTDSNEMRMLHTKCDSVVIMIDKDTYDIIQQLSDSLLNRYKKKVWKNLQRVAVLCSTMLMDYSHKSHKISLRRGGSYIDYPEQIKSRKPQ